MISSSVRALVLAAAWVGLWSAACAGPAGVHALQQPVPGSVSPVMLMDVRRLERRSTEIEVGVEAGAGAAAAAAASGGSASSESAAATEAGTSTSSSETAAATETAAAAGISGSDSPSGTGASSWSSSSDEPKNSTTPAVPHPAPHSATKTSPRTPSAGVDPMMLAKMTRLGQQLADKMYENWVAASRLHEYHAAVVADSLGGSADALSMGMAEDEMSGVERYASPNEEYVSSAGADEDVSEPYVEEPPAPPPRRSGSASRGRSAPGAAHHPYEVGYAHGYAAAAAAQSTPEEEAGEEDEYEAPPAPRSRGKSGRAGDGKKVAIVQF